MLLQNFTLSPSFNTASFNTLITLYGYTVLIFNLHRSTFWCLVLLNILVPCKSLLNKLTLSTYWTPLWKKSEAFAFSPCLLDFNSHLTCWNVAGNALPSNYLCTRENFTRMGSIQRWQLRYKAPPQSVSLNSCALSAMIVMFSLKPVLSNDATEFESWEQTLHTIPTLSRLDSTWFLWLVSILCWYAPAQLSSMHLFTEW